MEGGEAWGAVGDCSGDGSGGVSTSMSITGGAGRKAVVWWDRYEAVTRSLTWEAYEVSQTARTW